MIVLNTSINAESVANHYNVIGLGTARVGVHKFRNPASFARMRMRFAVWPIRSNLDVHSFTDTSSWRLVDFR